MDDSTCSDAAVLANHYEQGNAALARLLHDGAAQKLTAAMMELSLWKEDLDHGRPVSAAAVQSLLNTLQSISADLRTVSSALRPRALDLFGLTAFIESLAHTHRCDFAQPDQPVHTTDGVGVQMARIAAAMLPEATGPAGQVELAQRGGTVQLRISGSKTLEIPAHVAARVRALAGTIQQDGTAVTFSLPVK